MINTKARQILGICELEGCFQFRKAKGKCARHYYMVKYYKYNEKQVHKLRHAKNRQEMLSKFGGKCVICQADDKLGFVVNPEFTDMAAGKSIVYFLMRNQRVPNLAKVACSKHRKCGVW